MTDNFGSDFMTIVDEDGTEYELEILTTMDYNGFTYLAVIPAGAEDDDFLKGIAYLFHAQSFPCELIAGSFETVGHYHVSLCMPVAPAGSQCYDQLAAPAEIFRCALQCLVCILNEFLPALCGE